VTNAPRRKIKLDFWFFVKAIVLVALCLFIVYPFYTILTKSVFSSKVEGMTLYNFQRFFSKNTIIARCSVLWSSVRSPRCFPVSSACSSPM